MKKNVVRIVAALLVALLALTLIPMGAFAIDAIYVEKEYYKAEEPSIYDFYTNYDSLGGEIYKCGETISAKDFDKHVVVGSKLYDFSGFYNGNTGDKSVNKKLDDFFNKNYPGDDASLEDMEKFGNDFAKYANKLYRNTKMSFSKSSIKIDAFPTEPDYSKITDPDALAAAEAAYIKAYNEWVKKYGWIVAGYSAHQHKLSRWYSDGTTHWKECLVCKKYREYGLWEQFMYQNWCQDGDEDGICNVCGGVVPYHDIKTIDVEGATITLNRDNASHRMKITADVEAKDGYEVGKVHFVKVRDDGTRQEITRYTKNGQFWTYMPTYEMEVSVDVTKK